MDVLEMDAASESGVDDVRQAIVEAAEYQPSFCRFRIFIIDEVHDLSAKAFDALLKTIEEPPSHVVFILATTEFNKVPPTVRSRCQRFDFHRGTVQELAGRLAFVAEKEKVDCEPAALAAIARMADGGFRDALTLLDQAVLTSEGNVTLELVYGQLGLINDEVTDSLLKAVSASDIELIITNLDKVYRSGRDPRAIIESLVLRLAELTRAAYGVEIGGLEDSALEASLTSTASELGKEKILEYRSALAEAHRHIREVSLPKIWVESELIRIAQGAGKPQAVAAPRAAQPAPAQPAPTQSTPKPQAKIAESEKTQEPTPAATITPEPVATGDKEFDKLAACWSTVIVELSAVSKVAAARLIKSRLIDKKVGIAIIGFDRESDADWVKDKLKVQQAVIKSWEKNGGQGYVLKFEPDKKNSFKPKPPETATVELASEGESLEKMGHEVFGQAEAKTE